MIRKARITDVPALQNLINHFADRDEMLPRSLNAIYEDIRDFFVAEHEGDIVGCCALHIAWGDLAEIKSLAVHETLQGKGYGRMLITACMNEAQEMGLPKVFALTYKPEFFENMGFSRIDKGDLPHKIWSECINCPKFPDCGEEAVEIRF
ncbi:MAG: N-acetyltransferase [Gammaproteobacteria bacterium]|nr:N-acetyltransferase [Gammaproteobacteria bacterium]